MPSMLKYETHVPEEESNKGLATPAITLSESLKSAALPPIPESASYDTDPPNDTSRNASNEKSETSF